MTPVKRPRWSKLLKGVLYVIMLFLLVVSAVKRRKCFKKRKKKKVFCIEKEQTILSEKALMALYVQTRTKVIQVLCKGVYHGKVLQTYKPYFRNSETEDHLLVVFYREIDRQVQKT